MVEVAVEVIARSTADLKNWAIFSCLGVSCTIEPNCPGCRLHLCSQVFHKLPGLVLDEDKSIPPISKLNQEHRDLRLLWGLLSLPRKN